VTAAVTTRPEGLTGAEVSERVEREQTNAASERTSRTYAEIVKANVLTRFNAILGSMFVVVIVVGSPGDGLFGGVMVLNSLIGIVQETRAKRKLDQLALLSAPRATVIRDGEEHEVVLAAVVLDDLVALATGDQVPCDGVVAESRGLEIDESLLTGESDPIDKPTGVDVMSGSFVVAGSGRFQATAVGDDAYARKLATEARRFSLTRSELMDGINKILRFVSFLIIPVALALLWSQWRANDDNWREAALGVVAGVVGLIPQGLVLLTSVAFTVAATQLARRKVLVQELPAVEGLARVDVFCADKTGTLTEGDVEFAELRTLDGDSERAHAALGALADDPNANATTLAIAEAVPSPGWTRTDSVPFSSTRKWSAASFDDHGSWVLGAPEMVLSDASVPARQQADTLAAEGNRVLMLARGDLPLNGEALPADIEPRALVLMGEKIRPDAAETIKYFTEQGVTVKVISGDNPRTVAAIARKVGVPGADAGAFDARELPEDPDALADILDQYQVFGRVTPHQKRAMVTALQSRGHTVAMTGDGVNDALALKDADIGVAMGSGAPATRAVAQIVLLDGRFATMPGVVAEGRKVMANIERVATLFLTKTVYSALIAVFIVATEVVLVQGWPFPFKPRHLTLIADFTIGVPAFFLALAPNTQRYVPGFLSRVLRFAIPAGIVAAAAALTAYGLARLQGVTTAEAQTVAALVLTAVALWVLTLIARPFTVWRIVLVAAMAGLVVAVCVLPFLRNFFQLEFADGVALGEAVLVTAAAMVTLEFGYRATHRVAAARAARGSPSA